MKKKNKFTQFNKTTFFKALKRCKKIHIVLFFDIIAILLVISPFFFSNFFLGHYIEYNDELKPIINKLSQLTVNQSPTQQETAEIQTLFFNNQDSILSFVVIVLFLFIFSLSVANAFFSGAKGFSWSFGKYLKIKRTFILHFFKNSFFWLLLSFLVIFLFASVLGGVGGMIFLQLIMLFYFYLTFFVFYPLLALEEHIGFKKLFKKTWVYGMKFRYFVTPFLLFFIVLILASVIFGLLFTVNSVVGSVIFLLVLIIYLAFQKYYLLLIIEKVKKIYG